jgi:hypothetical protein
MKKVLLILIGTISVILGIIGMALPILPTTPFLLLAAACYMNASPKMYRWLVGNKYLGTYIKNYRDGRGMAKRDKIITIASLWIGISLSIYLISLDWVKILLFFIAFFVSRHILSLRTIISENSP